MKKPPAFRQSSFCEQCRHRRLHAALKRLSIYETERLAFTDAANVIPVNSTGEVKVRPWWLAIHYRRLRLRLHRLSLFLL
jgi:hypothetical protein